MQQANGTEMGFGAATKCVDAMRLTTNEMELPDSQWGPDIDLEADNFIFDRFIHDHGKIEFAMHSILHLECTKRSERLSLILLYRLQLPEQDSFEQYQYGVGCEGVADT